MTACEERREDDARLARRVNAHCRWRQVEIGEEHTRLGGDVRALFEALESGEFSGCGGAVLPPGAHRALEKRIDALDARRNPASSTWRQRVLARFAGNAPARSPSPRERRRRLRREFAELVERALTPGGRGRV